MRTRRTAALLALVLGCSSLAILLFLYLLSGAEREPVSTAAAAGTQLSAVTPSAPEAVRDDEPPPVEAAADRAAPVSAAPPAVGDADDATLVVHGNLLDAEGRRIRGAWSAGVSLTDARGRRRHAEAKEEGAYAFSGILPGVHWIAAHASGYRSHEDRIELTPEPRVVKKDFALAKAVVLRIRVVTPEGKPLVAALQASAQKSVRFELVPVATREPPGASYTDVRGSLNNRFGVGTFWNYGPPVEGLPAGCLGVLELEADLPVHVSLVLHHAVLETKLVPPGTEEVEFVIEPERVVGALSGLRMKFVDAETSHPVAGVRCMLMGGPSVGFGNASDAEGDLVLADQMPGELDLRASKEGYAGYRRAVELVPGATTDLGMIALEREVLIQGRIVDELGRAVAVELSLGVLGENQRSVEFDRTTKYKSAADGTFKIGRLGRAAYVLRTANHDATNSESDEGSTRVSGHVLADTRPGSLDALEIRLVVATKVVLRFEGGPADGLRFEVRDERGWPLVSSRFYGSAPRPLRLPPGNYRVNVRDPAGTFEAERNLVVGAEPVELVIER